MISSFDPAAELAFPKSLYLIWPLVSSYELGPVAPAAQASVPVPEGLDLDAWIVPAMQEPADDAIEKSKKSRKGKEKETSNRTRAKGSKKKRKEDSNVEELVPEAPEETAEERAERERVSFSGLMTLQLVSDVIDFQLKTDRLERMREDPYYITDERPLKMTLDDVDSIPVVRLDDLPPPLLKGDLYRAVSLQH